jgi:hypothetical protein
VERRGEAPLESDSIVEEILHTPLVEAILGETIMPARQRPNVDEALKVMQQDHEYRMTAMMLEAYVNAVVRAIAQGLGIPANVLQEPPSFTNETPRSISVTILEDRAGDLRENPCRRCE